VALSAALFQPRFLLQKRCPTAISAPVMPAAHIDIQHVAKLSRLSLTPEEAAHYEKQLNGVLAYIDTLTAHDLGDVEPTAHAMPVWDVTRADTSRPGFSQEQCLSNAPKRVGDQFQIPKVIE
jgi:aspartyl-tRNA(Asn)/glutamyl-tRNA(Gln) amidotransferase subunit C